MEDDQAPGSRHILQVNVWEQACLDELEDTLMASEAVAPDTSGRKQDQAEGWNLCWPWLIIRKSEAKWFRERTAIGRRGDYVAGSNHKEAQWNRSEKTHNKSRGMGLLEHVSLYGLSDGFPADPGAEREMGSRISDSPPSSVFPQMLSFLFP